MRIAARSLSGAWRLAVKAPAHAASPLLVTRFSMRLAAELAVLAQDETLPHAHCGSLSFGRLVAGRQGYRARRLAAPLDGTMTLQLQRVLGLSVVGCTGRQRCLRRDPLRAPVGRHLPAAPAAAEPSWCTGKKGCWVR